MKAGKEISECPPYCLELMYQTGPVPDPRSGICSLCFSSWMITESCAVLFTLLENYLVRIVLKVSLSDFIRMVKNKQRSSFRFSPDLLFSSCSR